VFLYNSVHCCEKRKPLHMLASGYEPKGGFRQSAGVGPFGLTLECVERKTSSASVLNSVTLENEGTCPGTFIFITCPFTPGSTTSTMI
jgi:hypothetical protein